MHTSTELESFDVFGRRTRRGNATRAPRRLAGGGWCYDEDLCYERSKTGLGSSKGWAASMGCGCMNLKDGATWDDADPIDHDCNCIYTPYCDGASFSGYRAAPWPVPGRDGEALTFRGIRNFDALMDGALERGLGGASEFVLTGGSAGGLSTFLHLDRAAARLAGAPTRVTGAPVVGFFLEKLCSFVYFHQIVETKMLVVTVGSQVGVPHFKKF